MTTPHPRGGGFPRYDPEAALSAPPDACTEACAVAEQRAWIWADAVGMVHLSFFETILILDITCHSAQITFRSDLLFITIVRKYFDMTLYPPRRIVVDVIKASR